MNQGGEPHNLLVVPRTWTALLLHLAHLHPLGDHLFQNTFEKTARLILKTEDSFSLPFERVSMDLVGLLLKLVRGYE